MRNLKAPNWCSDAKLTTKGWVKNSEVLVAFKVTQEEVDMYNDSKNQMVSLNEAPTSNISINQMNEDELKSIKSDVKPKRKSHKRKSSNKKD